MARLLMRALLVALVLSLCVGVAVSRGRPAASESSDALWRCWHESYPDPCASQVNAVDFVSDEGMQVSEAGLSGLGAGARGWAVGDDGLLMRFDGRSWHAVARQTDRDLNGVHVVSAHEAWAVGDEGTILRFSGGRWEPLQYNRGRDLYNVRAVSSVDVWVVGAAGFIAHWDGAAFRVYPTLTTDDLHALELVGSSASVCVDSHVAAGGGAEDGWAAGGDTLLRWDGEQWHRFPAPPDTLHDLRDIRMLDREAGWAVGRTILRWDGAEWTESVSQRDVDGLLRELDLASSGDGWAVGGDSVWTLHGGSWTRSMIGGSRGGYRAVGIEPEPGAGRGPAEGGLDQLRAWAFGSGSEAQGGRESLPWREILHWTGSDWEVAFEVTTQQFDVVAVEPGGGAWRHGRREEFSRWDGVSWRRVATSPGFEDVRDIDALGADDAWAVGGEGIVHWDGNSWRPPAFASEEAAAAELEAVFALSGDLAWAVGQRGAILQWDGSSWAKADSPTGVTLRAVSAAAEHDAWAVGSDGVIIHWDGRAWHKVHTAMGTELRGVLALGRSDAWAVGNATAAGAGARRRTGTGMVLAVTLLAPEGLADAAVGDVILRWDGTEWTSVAVPGPVGQGLIAIAGGAPNDVWVIGGRAGGSLLHFDGQAWSWRRTPGGFLPADISVARAGGPAGVEGSGWIAGTTMLRRAPGPVDGALFIPLAQR